MGKPLPAEDGEHGGIFGKHLGVELLYVSLPGDANEMLQDKRGNATATIIAVGHEGDLGPVLTLSGVRPPPIRVRRPLLASRRREQRLG